ncbi:MAG: hypothetical protein AB7O92_12200 [Acidimicrobiia bacterium]
MANSAGLSPHFFDGQQLSAADLNQAQRYLRDRLRLHNRFLHGWGVACGAAVAPGPGPWSVTVGPGLVVTPGGDEVHLGPDEQSFDVEEAVRRCVELPDDCGGSRITSNAAAIKAANIDPLGKDFDSDFNREWVDVEVLSKVSLHGWSIENAEGSAVMPPTFREFYRFTEPTEFDEGTVIRIHSGAQEEDGAPETGLVHRYSGANEWRLRGDRQTIRLRNPAGDPVDVRDLERLVVYLVVRRTEEMVCPQPGLLTQCDPAAGHFGYSRLRDTHEFDVVCELPPSHRWSPTCEQLHELIGRRRSLPQAPSVDEDDCAVLAALTVTKDGIRDVDELSHRRHLLPVAVLQDYLHCTRPAQIDGISPTSVTAGSGEVQVEVEVLGRELDGARQVYFSGSGVGAEMLDSSDHRRLRLRVTLAAHAAEAFYTFVITFPPTRPPILSESAGIGLLITRSGWNLDFPAELAGQQNLRFQGTPAVMPTTRGPNKKSIYAITTDGRLAQLWDTDQWNLDSPAELAGQQNLRFQGTPAVMPTTHGPNKKSIYAITTDGRLAQLWDTDQWQLDFPAELAGQQNLRFQGTPAVMPTTHGPNKKSIYAITTDGRLAQLWDTDQWQLDFPAELAGQQNLRFQGTPAVMPTTHGPNKKSIYAITTDGRLAQLWDE